MQEVIGSTPIFSTEGVNEDNQAVTVFSVAAFFVAQNFRCKHGVNIPIAMSFEQSFLPNIDSATFEKLLVRVAALAERRIKGVFIDSRDKAYAEEGVLEWWEAELFGGTHTHEIVDHLEQEYRLGASALEMTISTLRRIGRLSEDVGDNHISELSRGVKSPRDAFRFILQVLVFRRIKYQRLNPTQLDIPTYSTLPPSRKTLFADYLRQFKPETKGEGMDSLKLDWLGTQNSLAALLVILKEKGWVRDYKPYRAVQSAFTKSDTIDKILRPSSLEPLLEEAPFKKDLAAFKSIKVNPKINL